MLLGIYRRVSTDEQSNKGLSLGNQEYSGKELAMRISYGYKAYTDAGIFGYYHMIKEKD